MEDVFGEEANLNFIQNGEDLSYALNWLLNKYPAFDLRVDLKNSLAITDFYGTSHTVSYSRFTKIDEAYYDILFDFFDTYRNSVGEDGVERLINIIVRRNLRR